MTSIRGRLLNGLMRLTIRRRLGKDFTTQTVRDDAAKNDRRAGLHLGDCLAEDVTGAPVPMKKISAPGCRDDRVVLYFHGGGFSIHMPNVYASHAARISQQTGATVYLVDYRLAPEHLVADCFDDAYAAYRWMLDQGTDATSIVIAGDSAGGGLTLGTCQHARDNGWPLPAGMVLLSPGIDATFDTDSMRFNDGKDPMFTRAGITKLRDMTMGADEDRADVKLSPGLGSLAGLPPMRFDVGTTELLLDDSRNAAQKAREQGSEAVVREWPAMAHVYQIAAWVPETRQWLAEAGDFMHQCWKSASADDHQRQRLGDDRRF